MERGTSPDEFLMVMVDLFNYVLYCFMAILPRHGAKLQTPPQPTEKRRQTNKPEEHASSFTKENFQQPAKHSQLQLWRRAMTARCKSSETQPPSPEPYQQTEPQPATNARPPANFVACQFEEGTQGSSPWAHRPHSRNPLVGARRLRDHASLCRHRH